MLAKTMLGLLSMPPRIPEDHEVPDTIGEIDYDLPHHDIVAKKWSLYGNIGSDAVEVFDNLGNFFKGIEKLDESSV